MTSLKHTMSLSRSSFLWPPHRRCPLASYADALQQPSDRIRIACKPQDPRWARSRWPFSSLALRPRAIIAATDQLTGVIPRGANCWRSELVLASVHSTLGKVCKSPGVDVW